MKTKNEKQIKRLIIRFSEISANLKIELNHSDIKIISTCHGMILKMELEQIIKIAKRNKLLFYIDFSRNCIVIH